MALFHNSNRITIVATHFERADLTNASLFSTNFVSANFSEATLINANLAHANLQDTDFSGANLSGADLQYGTLKGARFSDEWFTLEWNEKTNWEGVNGLESAIGVPEALKRQLRLG